MPLLLYRYLNSQYALEALQSRKWKIGRLRDLNDPLDCTPRVVNYPLRRSSILNQQFEEKFLLSLSEKVGVLCFSGVADDPVIWSHYADSHRGIALGFEFSDSFESTHKVRYQLERASLDYAKYEEAVSTGSAEKAFGLLDGFRVKAPSWRYEKEYRFLIDLDQCEMIGQHYFLSAMTSRLRQVVLGAKCSLAVNDVRRALKEWTLDGVTILRAHMDQLSYRLNLAGEPGEHRPNDQLESLTDDSVSTTFHE